jgi:hypothetical protein
VAQISANRAVFDATRRHTNTNNSYTTLTLYYEPPPSRIRLCVVNKRHHIYDAFSKQLLETLTVSITSGLTRGSYCNTLSIQRHFETEQQIRSVASPVSNLIIGYCALDNSIIDNMTGKFNSLAGACRRNLLFDLWTPPRTF